jgi:hypothetical protein
MAMARDDSGRYAHITAYNYAGAGLEFIYDRYAELWDTRGTGWADGVTYTDWPGSLTAGRYYTRDTNNTAIALEKNTTNPGGADAASSQLDRFLYPKILTKGNSIDNFATNYIAYFDDGTTNKNLIFRTFQSGVSSTGRTIRLGYTGTVTETVNTDSLGRNYSTAYTNQADVPGAIGRNVVASSASKYFYIGVLSTNRVVIAYYDGSAGKMKIKYSTNTVDGSATTGITFTESAIALPNYTGQNVSMVIDSADHIHLAAFDAVDSDLKYIFIPTYNGTSYAQVTVDQYGAVGKWTQIKLKTGTNIPYISYCNSTEDGQRDTLKLAYSKNAINAAGDVKQGVDVNGYTQGFWEYATVPAIDPPQGGNPKFSKVSLGFTSAAAGTTPANTPVLGYLGTNIEFSYSIGE